MVEFQALAAVQPVLVGMYFVGLNCKHALESDDNLLPSEKFALISQQAEAEAMFYEYLVSKELAVNAKTTFDFGEKRISVWRDNVDEANKDINGNKIDPKNENQKVVDLFDNVLKNSSYNNNREEFDFSNVFRKVGKLNEDMIPSGQVEYPKLTYNESKKIYLLSLREPELQKAYIEAMFHIKKNELYGDKDISDDEIKQINESLALKKDVSSLVNLHIKSLTNKSNHFYSEGNKNDYIENKYKGGTNLAQISLQGDLLYSGAGKDIVIGNSGYDIILGATGNDTLDGREGNDILNGGADYDTYYIKGEDTIIDNDLKGEIYFGTKDDAERVQYFIKKDDNTWHSSDKDGKEDKKFAASRVGNDLKIWSLNNPEDIAVIKKYFQENFNSKNKNKNAWTGKEEGSLGLEVVREKKEEPKPEETKWDYDHSNKNIVYSYEAGGASAGVHVRGSDLRTSQFLGSRYNDTFVTGEGNSHIVNTMKGDDLVVGGGGNE